MQEKTLTIEQEVLLQLVANSISNQPKDAVLNNANCNQIDWKKVVEESCSHAVALATFDAVLPYKGLIEQKIYDYWRNISASILQSNFSVMYAQVELIDMLQKTSVDYVILKGTAAAEYYPKPELRALGDVDFLIDTSKMAQVKDLLVSKGYQKSHEEHIHHVVFRKGKAHLEMHFEVSGIPSGEVGDIVREYLTEVVEKPVERLHERGCFLSPTDKYHGLVLLLHMQHHMLGEGLGLRHLCDWATYVNKTYNEPFWEEELIPFLNKIGLLTYMSVLTKTCSVYLKSVCPKWVKEVDACICEQVIMDILACGNFGSNDRVRSKGGMFVSEHGKEGTKHSRLYHVFKIIHSETIKTKMVKKCKLLYPIGYIGKLFWHVGRALTGKSKPIRVLEQAKKRKAIYDKLKIFEVDS